MAIDMSQFYQVFFEEAAEHLASIENLLVSMDVDAPDAEDLNALFRAAHSIKGSSGTFGFSDMTEVTHVMETLLDMVRKQEKPLTSDIIDACLEAGDVLRNLLAAHMGEEQADAEAAEAVSRRLQALCEQDSSASDAAAADSKAAAGPAASRYEIRFRPDEASRQRSETVDNLVEELARLGHVTHFDRASAADDGRCRIVLESSQPREAFEAIIDFVAESGSVDVRAIAGEVADDASGEEAAGADDEAYGFFGPVPGQAPAEEEAYGLFAEEPPTAVVAAGEEEVSADGSFGLFAAPAAKASRADDEAPDGSYGLFAPTEPRAQAPAAEVAPAPGGVGKSVPAAGAKVAAAGQKKAAVARGGGDSSIRVSVEKVDQMINLVGELVITQAMLTQSAEGLDPVVYERLMNGLVQLERNTRDLQESVMSIRMLPISVVFSRFPRVVRDVSKKLGKHVELKTIGEGTELDKGLVERISDPLTHLIRNSLDHGIESPERRRAAGKAETGTITLKAYHQSGNIVIEVGDDGAGLNREKILSKARERGLETSESMSDSEVWQLIFEPGFSTADQVTDVSGRGVGMDVVKRNIASMGGRVDIDSMGGVGTRMTVRLPLTLAILDGMSVGVGDETYIIPLNYVVESLQPGPNMMRSVSGVDSLIQVRGEYLPVISLREYFDVSDACTDWRKGIMVILEADGTKIALFVDQLIGQHQVVIKSLEANYRRVSGISGATIMGDGRVALILDAAALVGQSRKALAAAA
ncbi:MAG: chemotaxis protein CheW [Rhodocyclaceae bacterium]|nr:chemotaxis protein CheW [Rhodocyclaceae bacterium]